LNDLLEQLHRAEHQQPGSNIINIYASGSQHIDNQYVFDGKVLAKRPVSDGSRELPDVLRTDKAMLLWQKVQDAGYIDEHYQPTISRTQSALLADAMAERPGIKEKWKVFEGLWNRKYMRSDYNLALTQQQSYEFQDELKRLFG
jgi:hypothetical protein